MSSKDTNERISIDIVAAARTAFAQGRRTEAIEMLRRFDLGRALGRVAVAEALQALMAEHQRLNDEERRGVRDAVDVHLNPAEALLAAGQLEEAWARACDAVHLDPGDQRAIALEARVRKALDERAGRAPRPAPEPAPPEPERGEIQRVPEPRGPDPAPPVSASAPAMKSLSAWWVVAAIVLLAMLLTGLAARTC